MIKNGVYQYLYVNSFEKVVRKTYCWKISYNIPDEKQIHSSDYE